MTDATTIAAHSGGLANAYRAALIASPPDALAAAAAGRAEAGRSALAAAREALASGPTPWSSGADDGSADDFATLLRARTRPLPASTDPQTRAFADAETALAAGRIATRSLMALFGGPDDERSDRRGDPFGMGADDGMATMFDGFIADIEAQLTQVLNVARQRRDTLLASARDAASPKRPVSVVSKS